MTDQSVLAAQRANDNEMCERLRETYPSSEPVNGSYLTGARRPWNRDGAEAAQRIEQLSNELREACHDRDGWEARFYRHLSKLHLDDTGGVWAWLGRAGEIESEGSA